MNIAYERKDVLEGLLLGILLAILAHLVGVLIGGEYYGLPGLVREVL